MQLDFKEVSPDPHSMILVEMMGGSDPAIWVAKLPTDEIFLVVRTKVRGEYGVSCTVITEDGIRAPNDDEFTSAMRTLGHVGEEIVRPGDPLRGLLIKPTTPSLN
jgi:hypothetical protein